MKIPKSIQKKISEALINNYDFSKVSFGEKSQHYMYCDYQYLSIKRKPKIGAVKDASIYTIYSESSSDLSKWLPIELVGAVKDTIRTLNGLKYNFLSDSGLNLSQIKISNLIINFFEGDIQDLSRPLAVSAGFWITTSSGIKIGYCEVYKDHIVYNGDMVNDEDFPNLLGNDYTAFLAKIDDSFIYDYQTKTFQERVDDIRNVMLTKEMFSI